ncbi:MAG: hypothetical protein LBO74_14505 [Candidatus Symbiothrix sp.]|jgi:hypothetical protein|nr:hypothetical protein [Candidatus Symbiothrix sp.]
MKRVVLFFLLSVMSLVAAQPTLAFHYCGGNLRSVGMTDEDPQKSCCGKSGCCSHYTVKLTTDDFQTPQQDSTIETDLVPNPIWQVSLDVVLIERESTDSLVLQRIFPPGGLATYHADLLTLVCTFRI